MPVGITLGGVSGADFRNNTDPSQGATRVTGSSAGTSSPRTGVTVDGGGRGNLNSGSLPATVAVTSSADLNALAEAVAFTNLGENLSITGSTFSRSGAISVDLGTTFSRSLTISGSTFSADVIKARSFADAGKDALIIDGSRFNASQLIRLYAEGGGTLRFRGNVSLNAPLSELAARNITIDANGSVNASGSVNIYTDQADFDKPGRGSLNASGNKTIQPHSSRPPRL